MRNDKKQAATESAAAHETPSKSPLSLTAILLALLLALIFWRLFDPAQVLFSNDGPYGGMMAELNRMPSIIRGVWANSNWFGNDSPTPPPSVSSLMRLLTTPLIYAKILCPVSLFIAGIGACFCFRKLRLAPVACVLGGFAAALNSDFFSTACWGVATQVIGFGFMYIAVGLLADHSIKRQWIRVVLAGLAVGVGVMEAYDIGALFSLFVAVFVIYHALFLDEAKRSATLKVGRGIFRAALVAGFAGFIAIHTLSSLISTQITGIAGMGQDEATRKNRWAEATSFSVPVEKTLQAFVPGIFGYRDNWWMYEDDSPKEDQYWSSSPARPIGTGFYAGVTVIVIALWAAFQSFRRNGAFGRSQRRAVWFWTGATVISLLFAWGSYAPFYQLFYALPYASTIRNPQKFMHVFSWALVILFAYGVDGLARLYLQNYVARAGGVLAQYKSWLAKASSFERGWSFGSIVAIVISLLAWLIYFSSRPRLEAYLQTIGLGTPGSSGTPATPSDAAMFASFSIQAVGWFVLFLALTTGLLALIFSGQFSGSRARWGGVALGALILFDLGRADVPWIVYWDLDYKYAADPIIQFLADKPYEHRVAILPYQPATLPQAILFTAYNNDWKQHLFLEKNIQCFDIVQEPRMPLDKQMYLSALRENLLRLWDLGNTRYVLAPAGAIRQMAEQQPGIERLFKTIKTFNFVPKRPNLTAYQSQYQFPANYKTEVAANGELAVLEYVAASPRAQLFSNWQVNTNDESTLQTLASPAFNSHQLVLVSGDIPASTATNATPSAGTVEINPNYKSKRIEMQADAKVPSVLLLSERYNSKWQVEVDDKPAPLLRCNFIERGVYLMPGKHNIVMRYIAPIQTLCISLAAIVLGLILWGYLIFCLRERTV